MKRTRSMRGDALRNRCTAAVSPGAALVAMNTGNSGFGCCASSADDEHAAAAIRRSTAVRNIRPCTTRPYRVRFGAVLAPGVTDHVAWAPNGVGGGPFERDAAGRGR